MATSVYVGLCDFGLSKHKSQCNLAENRGFVTAADEVDPFRKQYPQLALELVQPRNPAEYSIATDVYALGNIFETLFLENWDGMTLTSRWLGRGWTFEHGPKLQMFIREMMSTDPRKRKDYAFWSAKMVRSFQGCGLFLKNSPYLRD
ncbi:unnamed protein product [Calypogeia fissa]